MINSKYPEYLEYLLLKKQNVFDLPNSGTICSGRIKDGAYQFLDCVFLGGKVILVIRYLLNSNGFNS